MSRIAEKAYGDRPLAYPDAPGYRDLGASKDAAKAIAGGSEVAKKAILRELAIAGLRGLTCDEAAAKIGRKPGFVRPRFTEMKLAGLVVKTDTRRTNESNLSAAVWRIIPCPTS